MDYVIRRGDTLPIVARRFGVREREIIRANPGISTTVRLRVGRVIVIPISGDIDFCPVPQPPIQRFIPAGAEFRVRVVRLSGGRVAERVVIFRTREAGVTVSGIIVLQFTCARGWRVIFRRTGIRLPLQFLGIGRVDNREVAIIGAVVDNTLRFIILGFARGRVVILDRLNVPIPRGTVRVINGRVVVSSTAGEQRFFFNGSGFTGSGFNEGIF